MTTGGWVLPVTALIALAVAGAAIVLWKRRVRERRDALENQLTSLEGVLVNLAISSDQPAPTTALPDPPSLSDDSFSPRGPLSTAISILQHDLAPNLPPPDRVDLRATCHVYEHLGQPMTPADLADGLDAGESDIRIDKYRIDGFVDTELDSVLRARAITTVLFAGVNADQCVLFTLGHAAQLGYDVVLFYIMLMDGPKDEGFNIANGNSSVHLVGDVVDPIFWRCLMESTPQVAPISDSPPPWRPPARWTPRST